MTSRDHVESFARGLAVLRAFGPNCRAATLSDIAKLTGMQRSAARRFLLTLCDLGYATQTDRLFSLTPRVLELGYGYLSGLQVTDLIQTHLTRITTELHESSSAAVLDGADIVYIARSAAPQRLMSVSLGVGYRLPAYATSMGQALLADLPDETVGILFHNVEFQKFTSRTVPDRAALLARLAEIRTLGYAIADQELEAGLRSLAVAIRGSASRPSFAINVATNAARTKINDLETRFLPIVRAAADKCAAEVGMLG